MCEKTSSINERDTGQGLCLGLHHLGLSVPDLSASVNFFCEHLGFKVVAEKSDYPATFISNGKLFLTLWQLHAASDVVFDRHKNPGLHHFAIQIVDIASLMRLFEHLQKLENVNVEFAPEVLQGTSMQHCMLQIPGGLRLEFIAA